MSKDEGTAAFMAQVQGLALLARAEIQTGNASGAYATLGKIVEISPPSTAAPITRNIIADAFIAGFEFGVVDGSGDCDDAAVKYADKKISLKFTAAPISAERDATIQSLVQALEPLLEFEPTRSDFSPTEKGDWQFKEAIDAFARARAEITKLRGGSHEGR